MTRSDPARQAVLAVVADTGPGLGPSARPSVRAIFHDQGRGHWPGPGHRPGDRAAHRGDLFAANRTDGPGAIFTLTLPRLRR